MKKISIIVLGVLAAIIVAIYILATIYKPTIEKKALAEINSKTNAKVNFNDISLGIFHNFPNPTLSLHDISIIGENEFAGDTLADIKELAVELGLWSIITGKDIDLKSIELDHPKIDVIVLKNGHANYSIMKPDTSAAQTDTSSSSFNIELDKIKINEGKITYNDKSQNIFVSIDGLNHIGKGDFIKEIFDFSTETSIKSLSMDYGDIQYFNKKQVSIDLIMEMNMKENKISFKENKIKINHFQFSLQGFLTMLPKGYDMNLSFATEEAEFKNILSLLPGVVVEDFKEITTSGELTFSGFVKGKYLDSSTVIPTFNLDVKVKNAMFKIDSLPNPVENIQLDLVLENKYGILDSTIIDLRTFHMDMGKHPVHGRVKVEGIRNYKIDADIIADIDLAELEAMYPIKGMDLKGKLDFELKAKGVYIDSIVAKGKNKSSIPQKIPTFHVNMSLANGRVKYDSLPSAIEDIQLHLLVDNNTGNIENTIVDFKSIHMNLGKKNPIHGYLKVEGYEKYKIDADIKANLDLADIEKMYPVKGTILKGMFNLDVKANGLYDISDKKFPSVDAKINLTNGYVKSDDYPEPIENIHLIAEAMNKTGNVTDTRLNIQKLTYSLEGEPFEISGSISDLNTYNYDMKIKGLVDLEKLTKIYPVEGFKITGIIDSDIETKGRISDLEAGRYGNTATSGTIEIKNLQVSGASVPKPISIKDALFTFTPTKIVLNKFVSKFGKSNVNITGDLFNYMAFVTKSNDMIRGDLNLTCDTLDLNEWLSDNKASSTTPSSQSTGNIGVWEVPRNIDFVFDSDFTFIKYEDMTIASMKGEIKMKDGIMTLHETGFNTLNALFNVSGDYNTQNIKHPLFDFDIEIKELDIQKAYKEVKFIRDMMPAAANASGIFSVTYTLKGELAQDMSPKTETLIGGGELRIAEAKIDGMKIFEEISKTAKKKEIDDPHLKDFVMVTEIKDNKLYVKPFSLNVSGFNTEIEGVNDISGVSGTISYIIKVELLPIEKLKVPFHVSGTYSNPKVALGKGHTIPE
ncbi:MAG TPA: AsmA family protein [Cytophagaceae bacterium]|jgi:AsmA protein|nr:AsmA family protein [Cytophagaceae bacterium]